MGGATGGSDNIIHRMAMEDPIPWYKKKNLRALYLLLFPCVIGIEMTSGFDSQIINAVQLVPKWKEYFGDPQGGYKGILASSLPLGSVIGLPFIPFINDNYGRRWCIMFGSMLMIFGSLLQGFSQNRKSLGKGCYNMRESNQVVQLPCTSWLVSSLGSVSLTRLSPALA